MASRAKVIGLGASLPAAMVLAHGCKGPTQVTIDVRTNVVCTDQKGVDIVAASDPHKAEERAALITPGTTRFPSATTNECKDGPAPRTVGTLVLTPSGGSGAVVIVSAFGGARLEDCTASKFATQCIVARRRFAFVEEKQLVLPIVLDPECAGVPCNESSTCVGKKCVDSIVDCSNGTCSEPGILADGGLAPEVDGASPLVDAMPGDDGAAANDSGGGDASSNDAGSDASDGAVDAGPKIGCAMGAHCLPNGTAIEMVCAEPSSFCCYALNSSQCGTASACAPPKLAACCRGAEDCSAGEVCCATTATLQTDTKIYCRPQAECSASGGRAVCSTPAQGCGTVGPCTTGGTPYSTEPEFFTCS